MQAYQDQVALTGDYNAVRDRVINVASVGGAENQIAFWRGLSQSIDKTCIPPFNRFNGWQMGELVWLFFTGGKGGDPEYHGKYYETSPLMVTEEGAVAALNYIENDMVTALNHNGESRREVMAGMLRTAADYILIRYDFHSGVQTKVLDLVQKTQREDGCFTLNALADIAADALIIPGLPRHQSRPILEGTLKSVIRLVASNPELIPLVSRRSWERALERMDTESASGRVSATLITDFLNRRYPLSQGQPGAEPPVQ